MVLKGYSINTIKTYYYFVLRLINCYRQNSISQINIPKVWNKEEMRKILKTSDYNLKYKTLLSIIYGSGLRIGEALNLKLNDIDSKRMQIRVLGGKGNKDRYIILGK